MRYPCPNLRVEVEGRERRWERRWTRGQRGGKGRATVSIPCESHILLAAESWELLGFQDRPRCVRRNTVWEDLGLLLTMKSHLGAIRNGLFVWIWGFLELWRLPISRLSGIQYSEGCFVTTMGKGPKTSAWVTKTGTPFPGGEALIKTKVFFLTHYFLNVPQTGGYNFQFSTNGETDAHKSEMVFLYEFGVF